MCSGTCSVFNVNMLGITHFVFRCGACVSMLVWLVNCRVNFGGGELGNGLCSGLWQWCALFLFFRFFVDGM